MKNKWIIFSIAAMVVIAIAYYVRQLNKSILDETTTTNDLPLLTVKQADGTSVLLRNIPGKVVLVFFNPDCDHCQREAKQISGRKDVFRDYAVYFISTESIQNIQKFAIDYALMESNFHFSQADGYAVYQAMGPMPSVPVICIYNDKKLVKKSEGEVKLEDLLKFL